MNKRLPFSPLTDQGLYDMSGWHARVAAQHLVHGNTELALKRAILSVELADAQVDRILAQRVAEAS